MVGVIDDVGMCGSQRKFTRNELDTEWSLHYGRLQIHT